MSEHIHRTIEELQSRISENEQQLRDMKRTVNMLRQISGESPLYTDAELLEATASNAFRSDQFYGQPLSKAVREILEARQAANLGAATVAEVYQTLTEGGYKFDATGDENAKRGLRISLTKNSSIFHRLPNGRYGLREWYPNAKDSKKNNGTSGSTTSAEGKDDDDENINVEAANENIKESEEESTK